MKNRIGVLLGAALSAAVLTGCAGFSADSGFDAVAQSARSRLSLEVSWPRNAAEEDKTAAAVAQLLARPLSAEDAVHIALLNNRGLRASFETLRISEADLVQASRLPNPRFDLRHASALGQYDIEETLSFNILALLTIPYARDLQQQRFAATQHDVTLEVATLAAATREAYTQALAIQQALEYRLQVESAAQAGAELSQRMLAAGNWNRIDAAREQAFHADAIRDLRQAQRASQAAREKLLRLLGLAAEPDAPALTLQARLPDLPARVEDLSAVDEVLLQNRIDLQRMRVELDALARHLKLTQSTRFINVLDAGATRDKQGPRTAPYEPGYSITLEIPLFDAGGPRVARARAEYAHAALQFAQAAIDARSQIRDAYESYRSSYELAKLQRDEVVPLRKAVAEQNLLRYNASLISVFELLADAREQAMSIDEYIQRLRDFWIAKSRLDSALIGSSPVEVEHGHS